MKTASASKGTWLHRFAIRLLTGALAVLIFWALGLVVDDIRSIPGPEYSCIERQYLDHRLVAKRDALGKEIGEITQQIGNLQEKQRIIGDSARNLQQTINQLLELQKLATQKSVPLTETEQANFTVSLNLFLDNQKKYQELGERIAEMLERKQKLSLEKDGVEAEIARQREPAREEHARLSRRHRLKLAFLQLAILLPVLASAALVIVRKRSSLYFPLFLAFGAATLVKVAFVVHACFPAKYFKYLLIGGLIIVVARLLIHFIRAVAFPRTQWLVKQYREAYERFLCPVCEYPIRLGPRRFLFWTRRTVNKLVVPSGHDSQEEPYTCPACGSHLYEECSSCHNIRHALLPYCTHCGAEKQMEQPPDARAAQKHS